MSEAATPGRAAASKRANQIVPQLAAVTIAPPPPFVNPAAMAKFVDLVLGELPVDAINRTLALELEPGEVVFRAAGQAHAQKRHPDDFARCIPHVGAVALQPHYIGDDFRNPGKIELVGRVVGIGGMLVAVAIEPDANGRYAVCSVYPVSERTIENRRQAKTLHIPK